MCSDTSSARVRLVVVVGLAATLAGCGPTTLDSSSVENLARSLNALREPLVEGERDRFEEALAYLVGNAAILRADLATPHDELMLAVYRPLEGRTAEGIVAEARLRRLTEVWSAVTELEAERDASVAARQKLSMFHLTNARVFSRHRDFLEWPVIEIKADNATPWKVSLIHIRAAVFRAGEEKPWLMEEFDHMVLYGLEPGARDLWRIEPKQPEWVELIDPKPGVELTLEVMELEAIGGRVLAATNWGDVEKHRLDQYLNTLETIRSSGRLALDSPPRAGGQR